MSENTQYDIFDILKSLQYKIINPLPDVTEDGITYRINPVLGDYTGFSSMTKNEVMNDAAIQAVRIFEKIFNNKHFFIGEEDFYGLAVKASYDASIEIALKNLNTTESELLMIFNETIDTELNIEDYLDFNFVDKI